MRFLKATPHGVMDYMGGLILLAAPFVFGFRETAAATLSYAAGFVHLSLSIMTAYPLGVMRKIPFPVHGAVELVMAVFLIASPWIFGFSLLVPARNFFIVTGMGLGTIWAVTDYETGTMSSRILYEDRTSYYKRAA